MKLNDIYINLNKNINLENRDPNRLNISPALDKNIDTFNHGIKKIIKLNKSKKIFINTKNKKPIETLSKKNIFIKNINLKKIIKNSGFLFLEKFKFLFYKIKNPNSNNKRTIYHYLKYLIAFLILDFILASILFFISVKNLETINQNNYQNKIIQSYRINKVSSFLYLPFRVLKIQKLQNIIYLNSIEKNSLKIIRTYIEIYPKNKQTKIFLTDSLELNKNKILKTKTNTENILKDISKIKLNKNSKYIYKLKFYKKIISKLDFVLKNYSHSNALNNILGHNKIKKYLILFQNNDEIRATGGFPGSVGIISIYKGKIIDFKKEDIYNLEWNINKGYTKKILAPPGINKINPYLTLKDSNFFSSYFQSANSINFFLQKGNYMMDGIVFINTNTINKVLKTIGGVYFKDIDTVIDENNFNEIISILVEAKISKEGTLGTPKKTLFNFAKVLESKIKEKRNLKKILETIMIDIEKREIAAILFNKKENEIIEGIGLNGKINFNKYSNFIYPVFTSISQNKSDRYLKIKYNIETKKIKQENNRCNYISNVQLNLKHTFSELDKKRLLDNFEKYNINKKRESLLNIQGQGENKQFVKIILPKGSIISSKENSEIGKNINSNLMTFYTNIKPQEEKKYSFDYILKDKDCNNYVFSLIKQPGIRKYSINYSFKEENGNIVKSLNLENLDKDFYINIEKQRILSINR